MVIIPDSEFLMQEEHEMPELDPEIADALENFDTVFFSSFFTHRNFDCKLCRFFFPIYLYYLYLYLFLFFVVSIRAIE